MRKVVLYLYPVVLGGGKPLFENPEDRISLINRCKQIHVRCCAAY